MPLQSKQLRPNLRTLRGTASSLDAPSVPDWMDAVLAPPDEGWVLSTAHLDVDWSRGGRINLRAYWMPESEARARNLRRYKSRQEARAATPQD